METAVNEAITWLNTSQEGSKEEYEEKQKELEGNAKYALPYSSGPYFYLPPSPPPFSFPRPIMQKVSGGAPGGFPGAGEEGTLHLPTHHLSDSYELT